MSEYPDLYATPTTKQLRDCTARLAESGTAMLAQLDHIGAQLGCKRVNWSWNTDYDYRNPAPRLPVLNGLVDGRPAAARQAARQWANVLGLTEARKPSRGTVTYEGEIDGIKVTVWAVVDNVAFGGKFANLKVYAPDVILTAMLAFSTVAAGVLLARHHELAKALTR
ncbi:hypothetical protein ACIA5G_39970 [Amycolatopsis sp. NPDC051758]|uniref:hypothetical protein n=1 Tax=Amycolatopsis sp. NPDC051758 TaxID=3363935 RepID=UPI0037B00C4F